MSRFYPDSKVELQGLSARFYDKLLNFASMGVYSSFIRRAIGLMDIRPDDTILDLGAGTGRNALLMQKYLTGKGEILGLEISQEMITQFQKKAESNSKIQVLDQRIDQPFSLEKKYDKVFISFVFHGFPLEIQNNILANAYNALKDNGRFIMLDFNEFVTEETPLYFRIPFKVVECKYAFEYVERNWKQIMAESGFGDFRENLFFKNHIRLLSARKEAR
ncbi:MAG: class I SAM-dependent methyltransferase [Candidatus Sabulitectum sp.]|nr:class I SAM-dependent methyltransferase [Candidatus Sabulitectum sp.]